ncbi:MAG: ATP-binding cassette domain-containing protein [Chitinivibrionales bacterium]|nr:ATP-binding cassette domain-containing protein [Chitinivibrionales bacterium]MBD3358285.1 ATP-binding cassette domain-containing protein [Chitinivibrionales bacterium]
MLINLSGIGVAFGGAPGLDGIDLVIHKGQRICLLGRNGVGKSTLMRIIAGEIAPDRGDIAAAPGLRVSYLPQDVPRGITGTVFEVVAGGAGEPGDRMAAYHRALSEDPSSSDVFQHQRYLDGHDGWWIQTQAVRAIKQCGLAEEARFERLSGGMKRRVYLARALMTEPDLLLLDEPTNHMDIESIATMESQLLGAGVTLLFVTHDRRTLKRLATRIIELDRGTLVDWSCDYETFLSRKDAVLAAEEKAWKEFDNKLSQEEAWIRRGIKARRTRNEGRVRALKRMREERAKRRERTGAASMKISTARRSGNRVIEVRKLCFAYDESRIIHDLTTTIMRGDRVGIVGPNGCGKTTLLNLLLGKQQPQSGSVTHGVNLSIAYFDQLRQLLDPEKSVWENVAPSGTDTVEVEGKSRHVIGYLRDFLFTADRAKSPVKQLSGGERNRLMLARLFAQPANVLVFDEPTNDLDAETLELLEELLSAFDGTVLTVSHDREFLNNTVTSILAFGEGGEVREYVGGYDDWRRQAEAARRTSAPKPTTSEPDRSRRSRATSTKLSYKEKRELEHLPGLIEELEGEQERINMEMADPAYFQRPGFITRAKERLEQIQSELERGYARWEELEERNDGSSRQSQR